MRPDERGSTDVLSSLPLIACCTVAVMVLLAAIGHSAGGGSAEGGEALGDICEAFLEGALDLLTDSSPEGKRYLYSDWQSRAAGLSAFMKDQEALSFTITVIMLGAEPQERELQGNTAVCTEVTADSAPILSMRSGWCTPGEIVAKVGR